jgi:Flp pilus assembly protein TadD
MRILAFVCWLLGCRLIAGDKLPPVLPGAQPLNIPAINKALDPKSKGIETLIREGSLGRAEEPLRQALVAAPKDASLHRNLGIVYYCEQKYHEAADELAKSDILEPGNATTHDYLGLVASQAGKSETARKELEIAVALDPKYADAHFNLAVVLAIETPPDKINSRKYYGRAIELGADRDEGLEKLIDWHR